MIIIIIIIIIIVVHIEQGEENWKEKWIYDLASEFSGRMIRRLSKESTWPNVTGLVLQGNWKVLCILKNRACKIYIVL